MTAVALTVVGRPQPAGSKRGFVHPHTGRVVVTDDAKGSRSWKQEVAATAAREMNGAGPLTGPLALHATFYLARPRGHYGTGRNADSVRPSAPAFPAVRPDTTKLLRCVEDALTGIVWRDDAQVVTQSAGKRYGLPERVEVVVQEVRA